MPMSERTDHSTGFRERMRRDDSDSSEPSDSSETSDSSEPSEPSEPSRKVQNVKKEWNGRYVYLPDGIDDRIGAEYDRLVYECGCELGWKPDKNRHFYPVLIERGIDEIEETGPEEFRELIEAFDLV